jgi:hypothetical protein
MAKNKVMIKVIEKEDLEALRNSWHSMSALKELLNGDLGEKAMDIIIARHEKAYVAYNEIWDKILKQYCDLNVAITPADYNCDFQSSTITVTIR